MSVMTGAPPHPGPTLAIDQSTTAVGWCVSGPGGREPDDYRASGTFRPRGKNAYNRIREIALWLEQMIADWRPELLVVEEPCGDHGNRRSDRLLGCVLGVIVERARLARLDLVIVHPSRVRATGLHKHAREAAAAFVGKRRVSGDEADAIGLWQAALVPFWRHEHA